MRWIISTVIGYSCFLQEKIQDFQMVADEFHLVPNNICCWSEMQKVYFWLNRLMRLFFDKTKFWIRFNPRTTKMNHNSDYFKTTEVSIRRGQIDKEWKHKLQLLLLLLPCCIITFQFPQMNAKFVLVLPAMYNILKQSGCNTAPCDKTWPSTAAVLCWHIHFVRFWKQYNQTG